EDGHGYDEGAQASPGQPDQLEHDGPGTQRRDAHRGGRRQEPGAPEAERSTDRKTRPEQEDERPPELVQDGPPAHRALVSSLMTDLHPGDSRAGRTAGAPAVWRPAPRTDKGRAGSVRPGHDIRRARERCGRTARAW